jgi:hypothetical protein
VPAGSRSVTASCMPLRRLRSSHTRQTEQVPRICRPTLWRVSAGLKFEHLSDLPAPVFRPR